MKLVRYGSAGKEKPGIIDKNGKIRDLSKIVGDIDGEVLSPAGLAKIKKANIEKLPKVSGNPRLGPCVARPSNFIAIGLNYADHAAEAGMKLPPEPIIFNKALSCICGPNDNTITPKGSSKLDYEVELGIVIGKRARNVDEKTALRHVAGYCLMNDVSEREFQIKKGGGQWSKGKGCDTFGPIGPWLVTRDEIKDVQKLGMWLDVNGARRQTGNTSTMIFGVAKLVADTSQYMTLEPGDLITTGTPPGVALGMKPPKWLQPGDTVTLGIDGLGTQTQKVVPYKARR